MEGDKVRGFGWFLLVWTLALIGLFILLANIGCAPVEPEKAENGAICMTAEMLKATTDGACAKGYTNGYTDGYSRAKAKATPRADVELNLITREQLLAFLKTDQCDRCRSDVYDVANSCLARAECLTCSAKSHGWDSCGVVVNFEGGGTHTLVAFPLNDGTLVFVEPWYDTIEQVEVGKSYRPAQKIVEEMGIFR